MSLPTAQEFSATQPEATSEGQKSPAAENGSRASSRIPPREYYAVILNSKPFGESADLKPAAAPVDQQAEQAAAEQAKQEQALAKQIDMCAVTRSPTGKTLVGLVDKSNPKSTANYVLAIGESAGGFTVVAADYNEETATIERDGVSISLKLGKGIIQKPDDAAGTDGGAASGASRLAPGPSASPPDGAPQRPALVRPGLQRPGIRRVGLGGDAVADGATPPARGSYAQRIRQRRASEADAAKQEIDKLRKEVEQVAKTSKDEAAKRERAINLELISRGQQPLSPIELTPEEDAELVRKGVLDPAADK